MENPPLKIKREDFDGAIADFSQSIQLDPNDDVSYLNRGVAKQKKGNIDEALNDFNKAIKLNPKNTNARQRLF